MPEPALGRWASVVPIVILVVLSIIPAIRLLARVGKPRAWSLLTVFPFLGIIILLWVLAYSELPKVREQES